MKQEELDELWVPIPGYPNYEVSSFGTVTNVKTGRDLHSNVTKKGFTQVLLYKNGVRKSFYVHRLVAQAFFLDYADGVEVLHIDEENKQDNTVYNLELGGACRKGEK